MMTSASPAQNVTISTLETCSNGRSMDYENDTAHLDGLLGLFLEVLVHQALEGSRRLANVTISSQADKGK